MFREFVRLCRELELFGRELVAVDGTRIKAVNSRKRNFTKAKLEKALAESDERLSRYLDRLDEADGQDGGSTGGGEVEHIQEKIAAIQGRRERFEEHRDALAASGEGQLSLTDPDSRAMHAETRVGVGYNIQIAVDAKHKLIAEQQVHNKVSDLGLLAETAVAASRNLAVDRIDAVADAGYFKIEDIEACENAGVMPHVPKPQRGSTVSQGLFPKERFRYDGGEDITSAPTANAWRYTASASAAISSSPVTPIASRARSANSSQSVRRVPSVESCAMSTKRSWSAWQNDWRSARSCSMRAVKASSIPSVQSNNGWAREPS